MKCFFKIILKDLILKGTQKKKKKMRIIKRFYAKRSLVVQKLLAKYIGFLYSKQSASKLKLHVSRKLDFTEVPLFGRFWLDLIREII